MKCKDLIGVNIKDHFIGIVGVDFSSKKKALDMAQLTDVEIEISTIGGVLDNYLTY
jgi:hypothetical protein